MTRSHRRGHLIAWLVLSPVLVSVLIIALVVRAQGKSALSHTMQHAQEVRP